MFSHKNIRNQKGFSHHFILPVIAVLAVGVIGVATLKLSSAASSSCGKNYRIGSSEKRSNSNGCIHQIQRKVNATPDGKFGKDTDRRVRDFQRQKGLCEDGIVGKQTWKAMTGDNSYARCSKNTPPTSPSPTPPSPSPTPGLTEQAKRNNDMKTEQFYWCEYKVEISQGPQERMVCYSYITDKGSDMFQNGARKNEQGWAECSQRSQNKRIEGWCEKTQYYAGPKNP